MTGSAATVLAVRATKLGPAFDLLAGYEPSGVFFERAGLGIAGTGQATAPVAFALAGPRRRGPLPDLETLFGHIDAADLDPATPPPILFGSIPFDAKRLGTFLMPARTIRRDRRGDTWAIELAPASAAEMPTEGTRFVGRTAPHDPFSQIQLRPLPEPDAYTRAVAEAVERIKAGEVRKVVLARCVEVAAGRRLDPKTLLWRLRAVEPDCYSFAIGRGTDRVLVGASPELLVSRRGQEVRANPLAGSAPRFGDPGEDRASSERLVSSAKDREEHAVVVEAVARALEPLCDELTWDPEPAPFATANVWHLMTRFRGLLREPAPNALELVAGLHPTPAVCGDPRDAAMRLIRKLEPFDRGGYAGAVGWMDANGDGEWAIALRCAELHGREARLFAGAGIVSDSDPELELEETEAKFRAFLDSLRWG